MIGSIFNYSSMIDSLSNYGGIMYCGGSIFNYRAYSPMIGYIISIIWLKSQGKSGRNFHHNILSKCQCTSKLNFHHIFHNMGSCVGADRGYRGTYFENFKVFSYFWVTESMNIESVPSKINSQ